MKSLLSYINHITPYIITLLLAKALMVVASYFLPATSVEKRVQNEQKIDFKSYATETFFKEKEIVKVESKPVSVEPTYDLKDLILQAIYKKLDSGFIVVADSKTKQVEILSIGESYKGYKLMSIFARYVIFEKDGKKFTLKLDDSDTTEIVVSTPKEDAKEKVTKEQTKRVSRKEVLKYISDFDAIWQNIAIDEVKKDGQIVGFKVKHIVGSSAFGQLGLQKGDIIIKVNGELLTSYSQAFKIYKEAQTYHYIVITVQRNGQERELEYEIN